MTQEKLKIRFDGSNVHPATIDALRAFEVLCSYLQLVQDVARDEKQKLEFVGIEVLDECTLFAVVPSDAAAAKSATLRTTALLRGKTAAPRGVSMSLHRARQALASLPAGYQTTVSYGSWVRRLDEAADKATAGGPYTAISLRATLIRIGGKEPKARFESRSEKQPFTLAVTMEQARELGALLYEQIDISALVTRTVDGIIEEGTLREYHVLGEGPALQAWEEWFQANAAEWNDMDDEDMMIALGRHETEQR